MRILGGIALFVLSCVLAAGIAQAQRLDGGLRVTVSDKSGATVEDAKVTVTNDATNVGITANASSAGTYVFPNLLVGTYTISVEKDGFKKFVGRRVQVEEFPTAPANDAGSVLVNGTAIPVGTLTTVAPAYSNEHDFLVNSDLSLGKHQLSARYLYDRFRAPDFNANLPAPQFLGTFSSGGHKAILSDVWTLSSRLIDNIRASYSRSLGPLLIAPTGFEDYPNVIIDDLRL